MSTLDTTSASGFVSLSELLAPLVRAGKLTFEGISGETQSSNRQQKWDTRALISQIESTQNEFLPHLRSLILSLISRPRFSPLYRLDRPSTSIRESVDIAQLADLIAASPAERHLDALKHIISRSARHLPDSIRQNVVGQLEQLAEASLEEAEGDSGQEPITKESLEGCLYFLSTFPQLELPSLTVTPEGELYVVWRAAQDKHFTVRFFSRRRAAYVIFVHDPHYERRIARHSGVVSLEGLTEIIAQHRVTDWLVRAP